MRTPRAVARLLVIALSVMAVGACTHPGPGEPPPTTTAPVGALLLEYSASGGLCPDGVCGVDLTVYRSGAWHGRTGSREVDGQLDAAAISQLIRGVERGVATLDSLEPGPCPLAFDGASLTFTFHAGSEPTTVSNCDQDDPSRNREVPGNNALLRSVVRLAGQLLQAEPTPRGVLVEWSETGGHCAGMCPEFHATINADGTWVLVKGDAETRGQLDPATTAELNRRIPAEIDTLKNLAPSDMCPSAYDGRDVELTFHVGGRAVTVSNCTKQIPGDNALLAHTLALIESLG